MKKPKQFYFNLRITMILILGSIGAGFPALYRSFLTDERKNKLIQKMKDSEILSKLLGFGFFKGDKIIEQYKNNVIRDTNGIIQVVDLVEGTRFIIDLNDSKICGYRKSIGMTYKRQLAAAFKYIWIFRDKLNHFTGNKLNHIPE
jgi:hypothetical protein